MDSLCARWEPDPDETHRQHPLASRWHWCFASARIDQESIAREWGLLDALEQAPTPSLPLFSVAIR